MYGVSQAYIAAIRKPSKTRRLAGNIGSVAFTEENVAQGSFMVDNRASSDTNDIKLGSVYTGALTAVFRGLNIRGEWMGKGISVSEGLLIGEDTWEWVPLGNYHVIEAYHAEDGVHVTAYDNMDRLDRRWVLSSATGTPYDFLSYISASCNVGLGQTEEQIRALPNGTRGFALYPENDIETFRDMLFWLAQTMCCFATCDRQGRIVLRRYGGTSVDALGLTDRWRGSSYCDYVTSYTGVSLERLATEEIVTKSAEEDTGLTYNLGANPLLQTGDPDGALGEILTALGAIQYTPFSVDRSGCPAYDLGDAVTFPGGLGNGASGCIMGYEYNFHGQYKIEGYGANPTLASARSKADKEMAGIISRVNSKEVQFYTFENLRPIEIHDSYREIAYIRFVPLKDTVVTFQAEILLDAEPTEEEVERIVGEIQYLYNGVELDYHPVETWVTGDHILHLLYFINADAADVARLSVRMKCNGEITIPARGVRAAVSGQGLAATSSWDGWIEVEDNITEVSFGTSPTTVDAFGAVASVTTPEVIVISLEDAITEINIGTSPVPEPFTESLYINKQPLKELTWGDVLSIGTWQNVKNDYAW